MAEKSKPKSIHVPSNSGGDHPPQWPRQKPGVACEECRRRKLRCDRRRPQCGNCQSASVVCQVTTRSPRGPKQGYLKSLQARIDALEGSVRQQTVQTSVPPTTHIVTVPVSEGAQILTDDYMVFPNMSIFDATMDLSGVAEQPFLNDTLHTGPPSATVPDVDFSWNAGPPSAGLASPLISPTAHFDSFFAADQAIPLKRRASVASESNTEQLQGQPQVSRLVQADLYVSSVIQEALLWPFAQSQDLMIMWLTFQWLGIFRDQFYWDRVHVFIPIIHQRRYRTWSRHPDKSEAQKCLQSTMWALAASASTGHHRSIRDSLYQSSCRAVEKLASANTGLTRRIEYIQAWLLLSIYEFMFQDFRRGWISAGRAFRLIQLAEYESTDAPNKGEPQYQPAWAEMEERRRTLWLAYCLDRLLVMRSDTPLTFSDRVLVRLPAPEANFCNDQPARMDFLPDVLSATAHGAHRDASSSILALFVSVASMCSQVTSHRHQASAAMTDEKSAEDFHHRHEALRTELAQRMNAFFTNAFLANNEDPNSIFISIMWHTISLHLAQTASFMELSCSANGPDERPTTGTGIMSQQSATSVQEVIKLLDEMSQHNYLKVHPLIFLPLSLCAKMAESEPGLASTLKSELRTISERLGCASRNSFDIEGPNPIPV